MRLRYKLISATLLFTFVLTVVLSLVFLLEILRERVSQTESSNLVLIHQMLTETRHALENGLEKNPPAEAGEAALQAAIVQALQNDPGLQDTLNGFVRYAPSVQDAYLADAAGKVLVSTDPTLLTATQPRRRDFSTVSSASLLQLRSLLFGAPETLDIGLPLERNGQPFLTAHLGVRSTLLRNAYAPWLRNAALVCVAALLGSLLLAGVIAGAAMKPLEQISDQLDLLSRTDAEAHPPETAEERDAVQRVSSSLTRLDERLRTSEQTRTEIATNMNSMLQTLKDGVLLLTPDLRVAVASESARNFMPDGSAIPAGAPVSHVFPGETALGRLLSDLLASRRSVRNYPVTLRDGRTVELSLHFLPGSNSGALLTLHDLAAQKEVEREIEVARRLASIGRLTAGVGHEVKNPINAMVLHLELLRSKLAAASGAEGAQRHLDVLTSEMTRLDRVVQTLADFSRPMEPHLREVSLLSIAEAVVRLVAAEAESNGVFIGLHRRAASPNVRIVADAELLRQALLNIVLNAMQAMPDGGDLRINLAADGQTAVLSVRDTGSGIPAADLSRIFDLYYTTKSNGSGIGLAMTYRIIQLHGGVIDVVSNDDPSSPDRGTAFTLRFPLAKPAPASSAEVQAVGT